MSIEGESNEWHPLKTSALTDERKGCDGIFDRKRTAEDVGRIADQPMGPIEDKPFGGARMGSEVGHDGLDEGQCRGDASDNGVRILRHRNRRPAFEFDEDDDEGDHGQCPGGDH